jgi:hypothetical protein
MVSTGFASTDTFAALVTHLQAQGSALTAIVTLVIGSIDAEAGLTEEQVRDARYLVKAGQSLGIRLIKSARHSWEVVFH